MCIRDRLIHSAMRLSRKKDNDISAKGAAHVKLIIQELWMQSQDKIAQKKYTDATSILKAICQQLPIIINKVTRKEPFIALYENALNAFNTFPQDLISPELSKDIFLFLTEDLPIQPILENSLEKHYFETLMALANTKDKKVLLKGAIQNIKDSPPKEAKRIM